MDLRWHIRLASTFLTRSSELDESVLSTAATRSRTVLKRAIRKSLMGLSQVLALCLRSARLFFLPARRVLSRGRLAERLLSANRCSSPFSQSRYSANLTDVRGHRLIMSACTVDRKIVATRQWLCRCALECVRRASVLLVMRTQQPSATRVMHVRRTCVHAPRLYKMQNSTCLAWCRSGIRDGDCDETRSIERCHRSEMSV